MFQTTLQREAHRVFCTVGEECPVIQDPPLVQGGGKLSGPEEISCKDDESAYPLIDL